MTKKQLDALALKQYPVYLPKDSSFDQNFNLRQAYIAGFKDGMGHIEFEPELDEGEMCPKCGNTTVHGKVSGGVVCRTKNCGYWECF